MEINQFQPSQNQHNTLNRLKKLLLFTEIGLFEIGFVVLILGGVFGSLVFFHIINIENLFPKKSLTPTTSPSTTERVLTPIEEANMYLNAYLSKQYLPSQTLQQTGYQHIPPSATTYYSLTWNQQDILGFMKIKTGTNKTIEKYLLFLSVPKPKGLTTLTADMANKLFESYILTKQKVTWSCDLPNDTPANSSMCFTGYKEGNQYVGYEVLNPNDGKNVYIARCQSTNYLDTAIASRCRVM